MQQIRTQLGPFPFEVKPLSDTWKLVQAELKNGHEYYMGFR